MLINNLFSGIFKLLTKINNGYKALLNIGS